jgi:hypothetical protein
MGRSAGEICGESGRRPARERKPASELAGAEEIAEESLELANRKTQASRDTSITITRIFACEFSELNFLKRLGTGGRDLNLRSK